MTELPSNTGCFGTINQSVDTFMGPTFCIHILRTIAHNSPTSNFSSFEEKKLQVLARDVSMKLYGFIIVVI